MITRTLLLTLLLPCSLMASPIDDAFASYDSGDYPAAVRGFETALASSPQSAGLYYDLAVAQKKADDPAHAALNFRRAILLDPEFTDARMALSDIDRSQGIPMPPSTWLSRIAEHVPLLPVLVGGFLVFWVGAFMLLWQVSREKRRAAPMVVAALALLAGGVLFSAAYFADPRFAWRQAGVIVHPEGTRVLSAPADMSDNLAKLPAASQVTVLRRSGDWTYVALPDKRTGWIKSDAIATVVPDSAME